MLLPRRVFAQLLSEALMPEGTKPRNALSSHPMTLSENVKRRGGRKSRRTHARVWVRS